VVSSNYVWRQRTGPVKCFRHVGAKALISSREKKSVLLKDAGDIKNDRIDMFFKEYSQGLRENQALREHRTMRSGEESKKKKKKKEGIMERGEGYTLLIKIKTYYILMRTSKTCLKNDYGGSSGGRGGTRKGSHAEKGIAVLFYKKSYWNVQRP